MALNHAGMLTTGDGRSGRRVNPRSGFIGGTNGACGWTRGGGEEERDTRADDFPQIARDSA